MIRRLTTAALAVLLLSPTPAWAGFGGGGGPQPAAFWCLAIGGHTASDVEFGALRSDCSTPESATTVLRPLKVPAGLRLLSGTTEESITPVAGGGGTARTTLTDVRILGVGYDLRIDSAAASATVQCVDGHPESTASSWVSHATVNGRIYALGGRRTTFQLPGRVTVVFNEDASTGWDTTYVAGRVAVTVRGPFTSLDLGAAYAGRNANPCPA